jgi:hypothetical protein
MGALRLFVRDFGTKLRNHDLASKSDRISVQLRRLSTLFVDEPKVAVIQLIEREPLIGQTFVEEFLKTGIADDSHVYLQ